MSQSYATPEIVKIGSATELTEGAGSPNVEGQPGSNIYYNANPPKTEEEIGEDA